MKTAILVTHLLGAGHLTRAAALARAFQAAGHEVLLLSGGFPPAHIDLSGLDICQLPPVRSDGVDFKTLLTENGQAADDAFYEKRLEQLVQAIKGFAPDVLITELFPFGRRQLAAEFLGAIEAVKDASKAALVCASVRDILAPPSTDKKAARTHEIIAQHYDAVLVHSDEAITKLEQSWPVDEGLRERLRYTGYIDGGAEIRGGEVNDKVIVSAGGGAVGRALFTAAMDAARLLPDQDWLLMVGGHDAHEACQRLNDHAPTNARAVPARPDFRELLAGAAASVSLCGYNTALDLLVTGVPAVLVPFDAGKETEQTTRAEALARMPGFSVAPNADAAALAAHVARALQAPRRQASQAALDGAAQTVRIVEAML